MDRFYWVSEADSVLADEVQVFSCTKVELSGDSKTVFSTGILRLSSHRLIWHKEKDEKYKLALPLQCVVYAEPTGGSRKQVELHLERAEMHEAAIRGARVSSQTSSSSVKLSFNDSDSQKQFSSTIEQSLSAKKWLAVPKSEMRRGIVGIERNLHEKSQKVSSEIDSAFEDLNTLMKKAEEMSALAQEISVKLREKADNSLNEADETRFRSYLLSLGVSDPVLKEQYTSRSAYYADLARELVSILTTRCGATSAKSKVSESPMERCGGVISLVDAYCFVNRARPMLLISPEDLLKAAERLASLPNCALTLKTYASGVKVLQLASRSDSQLNAAAMNVVDKHARSGLSPDELARALSTSLLVANERLLQCERDGLLCRDESVEGLRFFPNAFLKRPATASSATRTASFVSSTA